MKQYVLMIAYFFPPEGSAGTYRSLRFARQLVKCGWAPVVICAEPYSYERYDPELLKLVPNGVEVIRVRARDLWQAVQSWRGKRFQEALAKSSGEVAQQMQAAQYHPIRSLVRRAIRLPEVGFGPQLIARSSSANASDWTSFGLPPGRCPRGSSREKSPAPQGYPTSSTYAIRTASVTTIRKFAGLIR